MPQRPPTALTIKSSLLTTTFTASYLSTAWNALPQLSIPRVPLSLKSQLKWSQPYLFIHFISFQSLNRVWLFATPWQQHARLPWACSNSCPLSQWCHPTISSSVVPFSSCHQSFPASGSFPMSQFFTSGGQSIGVSASASVLPKNIQDWFPLGWTGLISL